MSHVSGTNVGNSDGTSFNTTYGYDALGRGSTLTSPVGTWTASYAGNTDVVQSVSAPNGTHSEYSYDGLQRLTGVANETSTNAILSQYGYTLDNSKSIRTAMSEVQGVNPQRNVSYGYDTVDQLTSESSVEATVPNASTRSSGLAYDAMGNRQNQSLVQSVNGGAATNTATLYVHNKLNQMTGLSSSTDGGAATLTALFYDASGNMTAQSTNSGGSTYTYDDADRLISLVQKDTATGAYTKKSEYVYDAYSRKAVSREYSWDAVNSVWTLTEEKRRVYDGMDVVQERDASNTTTVNYTRSGNIGGLLARSDTSGNYFFSYDGSGNVVGLTDASQQSVAEYSYDAWGNTLRATGAMAAMAAVNNYRYSTKEYQSASGLYDYGFRFYSPGLGRWINCDPIRESGGLNLYGFVGNDPINFLDIDGLTFDSNNKFFFDWLAGVPTPATVNYGAFSPEIREMQASPSAARLRNQFYANGGSGVTSAQGAYSTARGLYETVLDPTTADWTSTSFQVGGFAGATVVNNGNGTMTFTIPNTAGANSFLFHVVPNNPFGPTGPMHNVNQNFTWTEPIDPCKIGQPLSPPNFMDGVIRKTDGTITTVSGGVKGGLRNLKRAYKAIFGLF